MEGIDLALRLAPGAFDLVAVSTDGERRLYRLRTKPFGTLPSLDIYYTFDEERVYLEWLEDVLGSR